MLGGGIPVISKLVGIRGLLPSVSVCTTFEVPIDCVLTETASADAPDVVEWSTDDAADVVPLALVFVVAVEVPSSGEPFPSARCLFFSPVSAGSAGAAGAAGAPLVVIGAAGEPVAAELNRFVSLPLFWPVACVAGALLAPLGWSFVAAACVLA